MKVRILLFAICLAFAIVSCSSMKVKYDRDTRVDLSTVRTYAWFEKPESYPDSADEALMKNTLLDKRIKKAVNVQLISLGLQIEDEDPDVLIDYHVSLKDKVEVHNLPSYWGRRYRYGSHITYVDEYKEGTIIIDVLDAKSEELIWRGIAISKMDEEPDPRDLEKAINKAVKKMFENLPSDLAP